MPLLRLNVQGLLLAYTRYKKPETSRNQNDGQQSKKEIQQQGRWFGNPLPFVPKLTTGSAKTAAKISDQYFI